MLAMIVCDDLPSVFSYLSASLAGKDEVILVGLRLGEGARAVHASLGLQDGGHGRY